MSNNTLLLGPVETFMNSPETTLNAWDDELEERINLARLVQNKIRSADCHIKDEDVPRFLSFRMNLLQFSLFLCWDLKSLRQAAVLAGLDFYNALANIESFVASYIQRGEFNTPPDAVGAPSRKEDGGADESRNESRRDVQNKPSYQRRKVSEADGAQSRDGGVCVVTKAVEPDMCHIWPFAATSTDSRCKTLRYSLNRLSILNLELIPKLRSILTPDSREIGATEDAELARARLKARAKGIGKALARLASRSKLRNESLDPPDKVKEARAASSRNLVASHLSRLRHRHRQ